ncbi:MAG: ABC transporter ATP-binding protein [Alphaproteobacteria bacterium]
MSRLDACGAGLRYGRREALRSVDATVAPGAILGIIGPNGSGKSSLLRLLSGVRRPDSGEILLDDRPLDALSDRERGRAIAVVPQETHPAFPIRVREMVLLGRAPHLGPFGWEGPDDLRAAHEAMRRTETFELAERRVDELSGGERQRVVLARALAQEASVLLLDEPTAFLDLRHAVVLLDLVRDLAREGRSVGLVVHDLNLASMYCDRLLLLSGGSVVAEGTPDEVLTWSRLCEVYGTELYVAPNDVTGKTVVLPLSREHLDRLHRPR